MPGFHVYQAIWSPVIGECADHVLAASVTAIASYSDSSFISGLLGTRLNKSIQIRPQFAKLIISFSSAAHMDFSGDHFMT